MKKMNKWVGVEMNKWMHDMHACMDRDRWINFVKGRVTKWMDIWMDRYMD